MTEIKEEAMERVDGGSGHESAASKMEMMRWSERRT